MHEDISPFLEKAIEITSKHMGFNTSVAITSKSRETDLRDARHVIRYMLYKICNKKYSVYPCGLKYVASVTGCTDHSTVINSIKRAEEIRFKSRGARKMIDDFEMSVMDIIAGYESVEDKGNEMVANALKSLYLCVSDEKDAESIKREIKQRIQKYEQH